MFVLLLQLIIKVGEAQKDLKKLNVFSEVGTLVDTSKAPDASPDTYEVIILELKRQTLNDLYLFIFV
jgi:hypothetical protein